MALTLGAALIVTQCQTLQEIANLRKLDFFLNEVTEPRLAGIDLSNVRSADDLGPADMLRLGTAIAQDNVPLNMTLWIGARNPESNSVTARLVNLDWTLFLNETETVSGFTEADEAVAPGQEVEFPVVVTLDLVNFFERSAPELVELVLATIGEGHSNVSLRATPSVQTPLGPIRYPEPITIVSRSFGDE